MHPRIAFWGTPDLTIEYLDTLEAHGMTPVVVITNPDRPKGRGQELTSPTPKLWADKRNIPVFQPEKLNDEFFAQLQNLNLDISIVVAYGKIMPERFINIPKHATMNVHYSILPHLRGASPVESAILNGDTETGISIQKMAFKLDTGPIIAEEKMSIDPQETAPALRARLTARAKDLLTEILPEYLAGNIIPKPQDESLATFCGKSKKEDGEINLDDDTTKNYNKFRAYFERPRTYFFYEHDGQKIRLIIKSAKIEHNQFVIERVIPEGKKEIAYSDFLQNLK